MLDFFLLLLYTIKRAKAVSEKRTAEVSAVVAELAYAHDSGSCPG